MAAIDETTLGGTRLDPVIVAGVPMDCDDVSCASLTVEGVPVTGEGGVSNLVIYTDYISARIGNLADGSLYHTGGVVRY